MSRTPSRVQVFRQLEAMAAQLERDIAGVSAELDGRQHRCPPRAARAATIFDGDPNRCPDEDCRRMQGLIGLRNEVAGLKREISAQMLRSDLQKHPGRKPGSRTRELVRAAEADLGTDAPTKALLRYIDARLPKGQKAPDESTIRKYRGKSGGN